MRILFVKASLVAEGSEKNRITLLSLLDIAKIMLICNCYS